MAFVGSWSCTVFFATFWQVAMQTAGDSRHDALSTDAVTSKVGRRVDQPSFAAALHNPPHLKIHQSPITAPAITPNPDAHERELR